MATYDSLIGRTILRLERGDDLIRFWLDDGRIMRMEHKQDCCESVYIEDVVGDLQDLIGLPLIQAEEVTNNHAVHLPPANPEEEKEDDYSSQESCTWTYYNFATRKGHVQIRWYGTSNGYYSETADLTEEEQTEP
jgi:hypothetical protein